MSSTCWFLRGACCVEFCNYLQNKSESKITLTLDFETIRVVILAAGTVNSKFAVVEVDVRTDDRSFDKDFALS